MTKLLNSIETIPLLSGPTLLFVHQTGTPRLSINIYTRGGNCIDYFPGEMDVIDRLLLKGTYAETSEEIAVKLDDLCLDVDTDTARDYSILSASMQAEDLEKNLAFIKDLLFYSTLEGLQKEKEKLKGELHMSLDSPTAVAKDLLSRKLWNGLPYGTSASTMLSSLGKLWRNDNVFLHYQQAYRPNRMVISVAGDVDRERLITALDAAFSLPRAKGTDGEMEMGRLFKEHRLKESRIFTTPWEEAAQAQILQSWLMPPATSKDYVPLAVLDNILGSAGLSSRLFLELRDKQGLAYSVRSSLSLLKHRGTFTLYIGTEPSNVQKCLEGFADEVKKLQDVLVGEEELENAKRNLIGKRSVFLETVGQISSYVGSAYLAGHDLKSLATLDEKINAVTAEQIQKVAQKYLSKESVTVVVAPSEFLPKSPFFKHSKQDDVTEAEAKAKSSTKKDDKTETAPVAV
jgi:predicted Zn-dependent peptidase